MPSSSGPPRAGDKGGMDHHVPKMQARLDKTYGRSMADPVGTKGRVYDVASSLTHYSSGSAHPADGAMRFASVRRDAWYKVPPHAARSLACMSASLRAARAASSACLMVAGTRWVVGGTSAAAGAVSARASTKDLVEGIAGTG